MKCLRQLAAVAAVFAGLAGAGAPVQAQPRGPVGTTVAAPAALRVDAFDVEQVDRLGPGTALRFSLFGTPGGRATLAIDGAAAHLELDEVQAGVYEGTYVVGAADAVAPAGPVRAELRVAGRAVVVDLEEPLVLGAAPAPRTAVPAAVRAVTAAASERPPRALDAWAACAGCAVVESIRTVEEPARPGLVGAMAGGLVGAWLGSQVGRGDERTAAGLLGAVGGAVVGREIERRQGARTRYDVAVRGADGVLQTRRYHTPPPFRVGDRLRLAGGAWLPAPQP